MGSWRRQSNQSTLPKQFRWFDIESVGELDDVHERNVSFALFDRVYVSPVHSSIEGERLLRQLALLSQSSHSEPKLLLDFFRIHHDAKGVAFASRRL